jgi:hypothetical protein
LLLGLQPLIAAVLSQASREELNFLTTHQIETSVGEIYVRPLTVKPQRGWYAELLRTIKVLTVVVLKLDVTA